MSTIEERVAALESALASMTAAEKRIVELPAASSVANDDFVALDGVANGSRRFAASNLGGKAEVMTEAEWDDLPDSKLTDGKVYALSGVSPSTQDNPLWQKLGFAALDTTADDCSDAINELNTGLTTLNSNLTSLTSNYTKQLTTQISDLNTPLSQGTSVIIFNTYDSTASNKPTGNSGFTITLGVRGYRQQMAIDLEGNIYARYYNNGTITSWVKRSAS
jgi:hypothetical protein